MSPAGGAAGTLALRALPFLAGFAESDFAGADFTGADLAARPGLVRVVVINAAQAA